MVFLWFSHGFRDFPTANPSHPPDVSRDLPRSQRLLLERQEGASSRFAEYLAVLPDAGTITELWCL